jgi:hypothetical protein
VAHVAQQLFTGSIDQVKDLLGPGFVWHYFNPRLPDLQGDYAGVQGVKSFLRRLSELTKDSFRFEPVSAAFWRRAGCYAWPDPSGHVGPAH